MIMIILFLISIIYIIMLAILLLIGLINNVKVTKNQLNIIIVFAIISLSIVAFCSYPNQGTDLSRYYTELTNMRNHGLEYVFNESLYHETYLANLLFYIVSLTGINGLLPAISTALTLLCFLYVLKKEIFIFKPSSKIVVLYILSFISIVVLRALLTGVRQHWGWSFILLAIYFDFLSTPQRKKTSILFYLSSIFIHVGTLPIILVRIFYALTRKYKKAKYLIVLWPLFIASFENISKLLGGIFEYAYEKLFIYVDIEYTDMRLYVIRIIFYLIIVFCAFFIYKTNPTSMNLKTKNYLNFSLYILIFGLASFNISHMFSRFITFSSYLAFPIFVLFFNNINKKIRSIFFIIFIFIITGLLLYQIVDFRASWRFTF